MSFLASLTKIVSTVGGMLTGPVVPAVIGIGQDVLKLIEESRKVVETKDLPALEALREELEPKVLAHADSTEAKLRGQG